MPTTFDPIIPCVSTLLEIQGNDCIGDTREAINDNVRNLGTAICNLSTSIISNANTNNTSLGTLSTKVNTVSTTIISTLSTVPYARLNDGSQFGSAPIYGARAWVNFDATRDSDGVANSSNTNRFIRNSGNVSNVLKLGTGDYRVIFTVSVPTADYCVTGVGAITSGLGSIGINTTEAPTISSVRVRHGHFAGNGATGFPSDASFGNVAIFC